MLARSRSTRTRRRILPEGDFGICVDELHPAHLLVRRDPRGDEGHQLLGRGLGLEDDERLRHLAGLLVGAGDDGGVGDRRVGEQHRLQLGRGDLVALVLDQLLEPVDHGEPAVLVGVRRGRRCAASPRRRSSARSPRAG